MTGLAILDIFISLIFLFLLYSLLTTAVVESIAAFFSSRAKNLFSGIDRLLGDDEDISKINYSAFSLFYNSSKCKLTKAFYKHPTIKSLGKKGVFNSKPSYISPKMFSSTLIDILSKGVYPDEQDNIEVKLGGFKGDSVQAIKKEFEKVKEELEKEEKKSNPDNELINLLRHDSKSYQKEIERIEKINSGIVQSTEISPETHYQLREYWQQSGGELELFEEILQEWFQEQMDRVVGWYKRKIGFINFLIGFIIACSFGVDAIGIAKELSVNDELRTVLVEGAQRYLENNPDATPKDVNIKELKDELQLYNAGISTKYNHQNCLYRWLGYLLTAIAISLGAPFWFDLLNKLMKLRSSLQPTRSNKASSEND